MWISVGRKSMVIRKRSKYKEQSRVVQIACTKREVKMKPDHEGNCSPAKDIDFYSESTKNSVEGFKQRSDVSRLIVDYSVGIHMTVVGKTVVLCRPPL
jgi:hypothetical protein